VIDRTYLLAALIVLAAAVILTLIGTALVRRFRASRWAEYDISLTERLERALGTGLSPLKVEPRSTPPSVETISTADIVLPSAVLDASSVAPERQTVPPPPAPYAPPADITSAPGEVWFAPEPVAALGEAASPDYELTAPVELRFAGDSGVVGIRADTETAAAFRRMADELTEGIDNDER